MNEHLTWITSRLVRGEGHNAAAHAGKMLSGIAKWMIAGGMMDERLLANAPGDGLAVCIDGRSEFGVHRIGTGGLFPLRVITLRNVRLGT